MPSNSTYQTCKHVADAVVDVAAIGALAMITYSGASEASVQIIAGAIASVAIGKRFLSRK